MENQTNYPPVQSNGSGANTILLVIVIIILLAGGYWWYTHRTPAPSNGSIDVNVKLPTGTTDTNSQPATTPTY